MIHHLQANGGTLFLDEIGDMPFGLQARLLRVLQERMVTPLGSGKSIIVNVELICATNHNLRERIAKGLFREDLYYRLNGLVVKLPPLRERTDLEVVVKKILATESNSARYSVSPELLGMFRQHKWPGNFRQLTNLLRTAIIMAGDEVEIGLRHMPDDFLDDIEMEKSHLASAATDRMIANGANLEEMEERFRLAVLGYADRFAVSVRARGGNSGGTQHCGRVRTTAGDCA
jgi:transcriptional regulator of acetoin/glycerol metabolism